MSLARQVERHIIKNTRCKGLVTPEYSGLSLPNVMHSIHKGFGISTKRALNPEFFDPGILKNAKKVVLLCVDGFGYDQLKKARFLRKLEHMPITSVLPSTTTTALSSLSTGLTPQEHGILGYRIYLRELGAVTNMLRFGPSNGMGSFLDDGILPEVFFPEKTGFHRLKRAGVRPTILNKAEFVDSPLSQMIYRGGEQVPFLNLPDLFLKAQRAVRRRGKQFAYLYWDMIDIMSHMHGTAGKEIKGEIKLLDSQVEEFVGNLPRGTIFILTADHGVINTSSRGMTKLDDERELMELLNPPPTGEARLRYLHCRRGKKERVRALVEKRLSKRGLLFESKKLLEDGWFGIGKPLDETEKRLGDFTLIPKKNYGFTFPFLDTRVHKGRHGGLSKEEMLIPLVWEQY